MNKIRGFYRSAKERAAVVIDNATGKVVGIVGGSMVVATNAHAALDASISTGLTAIQADAVAILALVFPVIVAVWGLTMAPKLMKRFGRMI